MAFVTHSNRVYLSLCFLLVIIAFPAFSGPGVQDTLIERLLREGQYRQMSNRIEGLLKKQNASSGNDLRLYYYNKLSMANFRLNNFDSALICSRQALELSSGSKDSALISDAWKMMAYSYNRLGHLDSALYFSRKLLNYAKRAGDDRQYRNALVSMGTILMQNQRPADALKNFLEANRINKRIKDTASIAIDNFNIGLVHLKLKQYDSCLYYMNEVLGIIKNGPRPDLLFITYGTLADCYMEMGKKAEQKKYLLLAMEVAEQIRSYQYMAMGYCTLIEGSLYERDFKSAVKYGFAADSLLKRQPFPVQQMKLDSMMYVAFKNLSQPAEALAWYESFVKIKSQVMGENQASLLNRILVEYQVKEKNLLIEKQESNIHSKTRQLQLMILLLVITALFIGRLINRNIKLRKFRESLYRKEKYLDKQIAGFVQLKINIASETLVIAELPQVGLSDASPGEMSDVDPNLFDVLYLNIISVLEKQKLYLDPELSVKALVNLLGTNKTYLYQAISSNSAENFRGLLNRYRVNEAKRIIEESITRSSTIDTSSIYSAAGFNSTVSFFRAFKHYTGLTPKEYANETRKEARKRAKEMSESKDADGGGL